MAGVEQNRYKTNNRCIKHLPQTGYIINRNDGLEMQNLCAHIKCVT